MPAMAEGGKITLVIPVFNHQEILRTSYLRLATFLGERVNDFELIFVNDGSRDLSSVILRDLAATDARVRALHLTRNRGQQFAIGAGLELVSSGSAITTDIDLPVDLEDLLALERKLCEGYELVLGRRVRSNHMRGYRRWGSNLVNFCVRLLYLNRITDFGCSSASVSATLLSRFRKDPMPRWSMKLAMVLLADEYCEMTVRSDEKKTPQSSYSLWKLILLALSILSYRILKYPLLFRSALYRKNKPESENS